MRVAVISPYPLLREGLCSLLGTDKTLQVVLRLHTLDGNLELIRKAGPTVLLIQAPTSFPELQAFDRLRRLVPETKILVLLDQVDEDVECQALMAGARGCVSRETSPEALFKALRVIAQGQMWFSHRAAARVLNQRTNARKTYKPDSTVLTRRETEILGLLTQGYSNKGIAEKLCVSENTVKAHLHTVFQKLAVRTRLGATLYCFRYLAGNGSSAAQFLTTLMSNPATQADLECKSEQA